MTQPRGVVRRGRSAYGFFGPPSLYDEVKEIILRNSEESYAYYGHPKVSPEKAGLATVSS